MAISTNSSFLLAVGVVLLFIATPAAAFGAGDIIDVAKIDGINYRHGDIENTLLELIMAAGSNQKFEKLDVKRVYFGNWLRDYSQAIDVGGLKQLPAETIRVLLWCLSFLTFGYATGEFEVTAERLGCYRPEEHIDNPKDYADNEDARQYDQRLRAPVNEDLELKVDPETGLKTYIASENAGCDTSAGLVRKLFEKSIELGRRYNESNNKDDLYEALRLLGTGLHCLEDFSAHSNYTELALRELGVEAFPHVGKNTEMDVRGKKIFPIVTGTFGMTDFLHSVVGELGDKAAQSEVEDMESQLTQATEDEDKTSVLKDILDKVPWDLLESDSKPDPAKADELKEAANAKAEETKNQPLDSNISLGGVSLDEAKQMSQQTLKDMYPILEFHDQIMKGVTAITSKVPGLDDLLENMSGALQIFIFSLLAPYVKPIIAQARLELKSGSEGILKSSEKGQYEVFENDNCTDPTHSMLSKDHFSNVLNGVAGQIACATVRFVVPQIVDSWSDSGKDVRQTVDEILQVFHHPALRDENRPGQKAMFETVKKWWEDKSDSEREHLKEILSFDGVKDGKNHEGGGEEGGHGHSHGAPPKKKKNQEAQEGAAVISDIAGGIAGMVMKETGLSDTFGAGSSSERKESRNDNNSSYQSQQQSSYGQSDAPSGRTQHSSRRDDNEESSYGSGGNTYGGSGGSGRQETSYGSSGRDEETSYGSSRRNDNQESSGRNTYGQSEETSSYGGRQSGRNEEETSYGSSGRNNNQESSYGSSRRNDTEETSYGSSRRNDNEETSYGSGGNTYGESRNSGREETSSYGGRQSGRNEEETSYGSSGRNNNEDSYSSSRRNDNDESSYGSSRRNDNEESSYGQSGREETSSYGGRRNDDENEGGYGSSRRNDNEESSGYGRSDENESSGYGSRRDNDNSRY